MSMKIYELSGRSELESAMRLVFDYFDKSEEEYYLKPEFIYAKKSLLKYDVFNLNELQNHVSSGAVKVFAVIEENRVLAVSALRLEGGKILFFATDNSKEGVVAGQMMLDRMVEILEHAPEKKLVILAFIGQEKLLASLGFMRISTSVFKFFGIKFLAMSYDYTQIDIER